MTDPKKIMRVQEYNEAFMLERHSPDLSTDGEFRVTVKDKQLYVHASGISVNRVLDGTATHLLHAARQSGVTDIDAWSESVAYQIKRKMLAIHKTIDASKFV